MYTFKKVGNNNLVIISFLINYCGKLIDWKRLGSRIQPSKQCTFSLKILPMIISISWLSFTSKLFEIQKAYSKTYSTLWANAHHDTTTLQVVRTVSNIKELIQSNLYKTTTLGTSQKWSFWTGGRLIKHLYKTTTNQIWSLLASF